MPTGDNKSSNPTDFQSLSAGLGSTAVEFGKKLQEQAKKFGKSIKDQLDKAAKKFKKDTDKGNKSWMGEMFGNMKKGWNKFWKSGIGVALKAIMFIGAAFVGVLVGAFKTFDKFNVDAAKNFGMISRGNNNLVTGMIEAQTELGYLGQGFADIVGTVTTLTNQMGMADSKAIQMATNLAESAMMVGVSNDEAAQLAVQMTKIMGVSEDNAAAMIEGFGQLADAQGVSPSAVLKDMAKSTEFAAKFSKGMGANILTTAIGAKKLGVELSTIEKVMNGLLDFESSITKEMEASVILGKDLNFNQARRLALEGNLSGAMGEVLKQVGGEAEFNKMNAIERQVLADSIGVSVTELAKFASGSRSAAEEQRILDEEARLAAEAAAEKDRQQLSALTDLMAVFKQFYMMLVSALAPAFNAIGEAVKAMTTAVKDAFGKMEKGAMLAEGPIHDIIKALNKFTADVKQDGLGVAFENLFGKLAEIVKSFIVDTVWFFVQEFGLAITAIIISYKLLMKALAMGGGGMTMKGAAAFGILAAGTYILSMALDNLAKHDPVNLAVAGLVLAGMLVAVALAGTMLGAASPALWKGVAVFAAFSIVLAGLAIAIAYALDLITPLVEVLVDGIVRGIEAIGQAIMDVGEAIKFIADGISGIITAIFDGIANVARSLGEMISSPIDSLTQLANIDAGNMWSYAGAIIKLATGLLMLSFSDSKLGRIKNVVSELEKMTKVVVGLDKAIDEVTASAPTINADTNIGTVGLTDNAMNGIGAAVAVALKSQLSGLKLTTDLDGEKLQAMIDYHNES